MIFPHLPLVNNLGNAKNLRCKVYRYRYFSVNVTQRRVKTQLHRRPKKSIKKINYDQQNSTTIGQLQKYFILF